MISSEIKSRILKLKTLADRGVDGEKDAAATKLDLLCKKHNIESLEDLKDDERSMHWFKYPGKGPFYKLLQQCIYKALGAESGYHLYQKGRTWGIGVECSIAQSIEIELDYEFYADHLTGEIERLFSGFVAVHNIYPSDAPAGKESFSAKDILLFQGIEVRSRLNQIGSGGPNEGD